MTGTNTNRRVLVTGATGFVGRALVKALVHDGYEVRATTRNLARAPNIEDGVPSIGYLGNVEDEVPSATDSAPQSGAPPPLSGLRPPSGCPGNLEWVRCDVNEAVDLDRVMNGVGAVFFLVHGMGDSSHDYVQKERRGAEEVRDAAARAGVGRIVYLGGVAPAAEPSEHLKSRLAVGEVLRSGSVPAIELRASMIIGNGSASWQIVRDLALRLPAMVLPSWTRSRTCPIALEDVVEALVRALDIPLPKSAWYDIPGPDVVSGRQILSTIAALRGRRVPSVAVPFLSVSLSSWWLKLVTRGDFSLARELVLGFKGDLLPSDDRYWSEVDYTCKWTFEAAARRALADEAIESSLRGMAGKLEEDLVHLVSRKL